MRLKDYMKLSSDDDEASFRSLSLKLVKEETNNKDIVDRLGDKYSYVKESMRVVTNINRYLKSVYKGTYKFDLCVDEGILPNDLKLSKRDKKKLSFRALQLNDDLEQIKKRFEDDISKL